MTRARASCFGVAQALVCALILQGCEAEDAWDEAICPEGGTTLSYENFGRDFIGSECQTCHASGAKERRGAPTHISFDDLEAVREWADRIYERSAGDNVSMPPGPVDPDPATREALGEWLACGAP